MKEYIKRYAILVAGLFIMALGVAMSTRANLGTSPVSCVPYVLSLALPYSMGNITIAMHVLFILIQIALLRKDFEKIQFVQMIVAVVFGYFTDFTLWLLRDVVVNGYAMQWGLCLVSCIIIAFGVNLEVKAGVVMLAGEGVMTAIVKVFHVEFGKVKIGFDCSQVVLGTVLSFVLLGGLQGIREGTIAAAILVGAIVRIYNKRLAFLYEKLGLINKKDEGIREQEEKDNFVITIAKQVGSGGEQIAKELSRRLDIPVYDKELIELEAKESGLSSSYIEKKEQNLTNSLLYDLYTQSFEYVQGEQPQQHILHEAQKKVVMEKAGKESCIIVGRLGHMLLKGQKNCLRIFIYGSEEERVKRYQDVMQMTEERARKTVIRLEEERENYYRYFGRAASRDALNYDVSLNSDVFGVERSVEMIIAAARKKGLIK